MYACTYTEGKETLKSVSCILSSRSLTSRGLMCEHAIDKTDKHILLSIKDVNKCDTLRRVRSIEWRIKSESVALYWFAVDSRGAFISSGFHVRNIILAVELVARNWRKSYRFFFSFVGNNIRDVNRPRCQPQNNRRKSTKSTVKKRERVERAEREREKQCV